MLTVDISDKEDSWVGGCNGKSEEDVSLHCWSKASGKSKDGKRDAAVEEGSLAAKPVRLLNA